MKSYERSKWRISSSERHFLRIVNCLANFGAKPKAFLFSTAFQLLGCFSHTWKFQVWVSRVVLVRSFEQSPRPLHKIYFLAKKYWPLTRALWSHSSSALAACLRLWLIPNLNGCPRLHARNFIYCPALSDRNRRREYIHHLNRKLIRKLFSQPNSGRFSLWLHRIHWLQLLLSWKAPFVFQTGWSLTNWAGSFKFSCTKLGNAEN